MSDSLSNPEQLTSEVIAELKRLRDTNSLEWEPSFVRKHLPALISAAEDLQKAHDALDRRDRHIAQLIHDGRNALETLRDREKRIAELEALLDCVRHQHAATGDDCNHHCIACEWERMKGGAK